VGRSRIDKVESGETVPGSRGLRPFVQTWRDHLAASGFRFGFPVRAAAIKSNGEGVLTIFLFR
jgi:hypothetical protein